MRYIHPVAAHERFVASGVYTMSQGGQPNGVVESWSIHELPDATQFVRVDFDARNSRGSSTLVEALRSAAGKIERFEVHHFAAPGQPFKKVRANFTVYERYVQASRRYDDQPAELEEIALKPRTAIYPPGRIFVGKVIAQIRARGAEGGTVFWLMPYTYPQVAPQMAVVTPFAAALVEAHGEVLIGKKTYPAKRYRFGSNTNPDRNIYCWIGEHDTLLQYEAADGTQGILTQYARRTEPKKQ